MTWSGSSSTRWCCAPTCPVTRRSTELLARVREAGLGALAHQDVPFERLVGGAGPGPVAGPPPAVPGHADGAEQRPGGAWTCPGCRPAVCRPARRPARFDLEVTVAEASAPDGRPAGLTGALIGWRRTCLTPRRRRCSRRGWCGCWRRSRPTRRSGCGRCTVLGAAERRQLMDGWNDTAAPVPAARRCRSCSRRRRRRGPDAVAVACGDAAVTYAELDAAAGRLAGVLAGRGRGRRRWSRWCCRAASRWCGAAGGVEGGGGVPAGGPGLPGARLAFMLADASPVRWS